MITPAHHIIWHGSEKQVRATACTAGEWEKRKMQPSKQLWQPAGVGDSSGAATEEVRRATCVELGLMLNLFSFMQSPS